MYIMSDKSLSLLIFLLAATILPGFPTSPLFLDCTVNCHIPHQVPFPHHCFLVNLHAFSAAFSQLDLQYSLDLYCQALLEVFSVIKASSYLDCFTLLLARHVVDVSCYIGRSMPSGICMEIHSKIMQKRK